MARRADTDPVPEPPPQEKSAQEMLVELGRRILGRDALMLFAVGVCVVGATVGTMKAYADDAGSRVDAGVAPVAAEVARLKVELAEERAERAAMKRDISQLQVSALETSMNVQLLVKNVGLHPIELPRPASTDGGAP